MAYFYTFDKIYIFDLFLIEEQVYIETKKRMIYRNNIAMQCIDRNNFSSKIN